MLVKAYIAEREKGHYGKGMIMEFVDRAVLRLLAIEKGVLKEEKQAVHTHTLASKDEILLLNGRLFNYLIVDQERGPDTRFTRREFLDAIKLLEKLTDDRPAKDRLSLLLSRKLCVEVELGAKGMTKLIKFKSDEIDQSQTKERELNAVLAKFGDLR
jgi:hypothetical protein